MAQTIIQWIVVLAFFVLFALAATAEILWLAKKGWTTTGRATVFVLITDILGFGFGFFFIMVVFFIMFMMVMGPAGTGSNVPDSAYWAGLIAAIVVPPVFLILGKRIMLAILKIRSGREAWGHSLVSSVMTMIVVLVPPPVALYVCWYALGWK